MTPPPTTPTPKRERLNMGELKHADDCQSHIVDVRGRPDECTCGADTRPRTEGRGEGQPVAWAYEYTNHLKGDRAPGGWLRAVAFEAPTRARVNAGFARNVQPLYASPIREPEISRTGPMFILPGEDPVEYMALMRQKAAEMDREVFLEELAEAMFKVDEKHGPIRMNVPYGALKSFQRKQYERYAEAVADAILNLAPVGGRGEEGSSRADLSPPGLSDLDRVWAAVNVLGAPDTACTSDEDRAYCRAIGDALSEIEKLGGRPQ